MLTNRHPTADRIGTMADRVLETQRIQSENMKLMQENGLEVMRLVADQLQTNNALVGKVIEKTLSRL